MHNQFSQILATFEKSRAPTPEPNAPTLAITNRSRIATRDPPYPNQPSSKVNNKIAAEDEVPTEKENPNTPNLKIPLSFTLYQPSKSSNVPFPSRLWNQKKDDEQEKFLSIFKHLNINLPFLKALNQMPKGAKVLKDLLSNKVKLEIKNALAYLGASINLMPHSLFLKLGILELKPTRMSNQLADRSIKYPIGICKNLLVKIDKFIFLIDFVILEMDEDSSVPIILGRSFLATAHAAIDVYDGKLSLRVGEESVTFNIGESMKFASSQDNYLYFADHTDEMVQEQWNDTIYHDRNWIDNEEEDVVEEVQAISFYPRKEPIEPLEWKILENKLKPSVEEPLKVEL
ncbi:retrotransposon protein, putative, ty3-gypsy subclass [Tanacetum coccineum]